MSRPLKQSPFNPVYRQMFKQLRDARMRCRLTPSELAKKTGLAPSTISRMENNLSGAPSSETLLRWCLATGLEPASLWPSLKDAQTLL
jgi:transcriptional regulator with XRE-family HTH domain